MIPSLPACGTLPGTHIPLWLLSFTLSYWLSWPGQTLSVWGHFHLPSAQNVKLIAWYEERQVVQPYFGFGPLITGSFCGKAAGMILEASHLGFSKGKPTRWKVSDCACAWAGAKSRCGLLASGKPLKGVSCRWLFLKERIWYKLFPLKSLIPLHFVFSLRWVELHTGKEDVLEAALHAK